jgi:hypothetical protein
MAVDLRDHFIIFSLRFERASFFVLDWRNIESVLFEFFFERFISKCFIAKQMILRVARP